MSALEKALVLALVAKSPTKKCQTLAEIGIPIIPNTDAALQLANASMP